MPYCKCADHFIAPGHRWNGSAPLRPAHRLRSHFPTCPSLAGRSARSGGRFSLQALPPGGMASVPRPLHFQAEPAYSPAARHMYRTSFFAVCCGYVKSPIGQSNRTLFLSLHLCVPGLLRFCPGPVRDSLPDFLHIACLPVLPRRKHVRKRAGGFQ